MYTQLKKFNRDKGGSDAGWCLRNVRLGYGIPALYSNAITAWQNTEQHKNRNIPKGVDVPIYFSWKVDGHIGVQLADGRFWSDGLIYTNLQAYEKNHEPKYLGWGESVNEVKVIKEIDMKPTRSDIGNAHNYLGIADKDVPEKTYKHYETKRENVLYKDVLKKLYDQKRAAQREVRALKAQAGQSSEANLLGKALIKLIASFGYKKG